MRKFSPGWISVSFPGCSKPSAALSAECDAVASFQAVKEPAVMQRPSRKHPLSVPMTHPFALLIAACSLAWILGANGHLVGSNFSLYMSGEEKKWNSVRTLLPQSSPWQRECKFYTVQLQNSGVNAMFLGLILFPLRAVFSHTNAHTQKLMNKKKRYIFVCT